MSAEFEYHEEPAEGEQWEDAAAAIERACGRPGWYTVGTFAAAVLVGPDGSEIMLSTGESMDERWAANAGGSEKSARELRRLVRRWLDEADEADDR